MTCSACGFAVADAGVFSPIVMNHHMIYAHGAGPRIDHIMGADEDKEQ